jgi:MinD-like ATPase involved in chromosome partitioning or flagellar assembly
VSGIDWLEEYEEFSTSSAQPDEKELGQTSPWIKDHVQEMELGAARLAPEPEADFQIPRNSERIMERSIGRIIAIRSVSPSAGRTVLAANLAFELASLGRSVCLVDLDFRYPTLHRYFGIASPKAAVLAGARLLEQNRLDQSALDQLKVRLVSKGVGVEFLAGYGLAQNQDVINWQSVQQFLDCLAQRYQVVLLDAAFGFGHDSHRLVDQAAQQNLWITQPDAVSIGRFIDAQGLLGNTQSTGENLLAVNRVRASVLGARPDWQIQQVLKDRTSMKISAMLPQDEAFDQAMLQGLPLRQVAGRSKALAALSQLAKRLA